MIMSEDKCFAPMQGILFCESSVLIHQKPQNTDKSLLDFSFAVKKNFYL